MARGLILSTLEASGCGDSWALERALDRLGPLMTCLLVMYELRSGDLTLVCGQLTLRIRFAYDQPSSERDDLSVPVVTSVDGPACPEPTPTLVITTENPVTAPGLLRCVEAANWEGVIDVVLRTASDPDETSDPYPEATKDDEEEHR